MESNFKSDLSLTLCNVMELAPFTPKCVVAKASSGHIPLPFLISDVKRTGAKIKAQINTLQIFFQNVC